MRADFSPSVRRLIAERAGYQCSILNCGRLTIGPGRDSRQTVNVGVAAHIFSAAPGGPRGTGGLSDSERSEPENGIWCCYTHGKTIDADQGAIFSAAQLRAWKRLHEARKSAEIHGHPFHNIGLVESISVKSAPAVGLEGREFNLGMRNIFTGVNGSGKSVLVRLIASVAFPDHVATLSRSRDVDMAVKWHDPHTHDVATKGRGGDVFHVLDGAPVPYVPRPYKAILPTLRRDDIFDIRSLAQLLDLNISAMKSVLEEYPSHSRIVDDVLCINSEIEWTLRGCGGQRRRISGGHRGLSGLERSGIIIELVGLHARRHALVEPTFLILDEFMDWHHSAGVLDLMEVLHETAEHAQIAVVTHSPAVVASANRDWILTRLEARPNNQIGRPVDVEVTTISNAAER